MKKILYILGGLVVGLVVSCPFIWMGSVLIMGGTIGTWSIVALVSWYVVVPIILITFAYIGYRNSVSKNPSKLFIVLAISSIAVIVLYYTYILIRYV